MNVVCIFVNCQRPIRVCTKNGCFKFVKDKLDYVVGYRRIGRFRRHCMVMRVESGCRGGLGGDAEGRPRESGLLP